jgi:drug/metabolite transporter (DMT)-like permease
VAEDHHLPSGIAALLIASEPLWVILFRRLSRERLPSGAFVGVAAGFAGVGLLLAPGQRPAGVAFLGYALCLLAAASWAGGSFISSRVAMPKDPLHSTALQMLFGGVTMAVLGLGVGELSDLHLGQISTRSALALAYLLVFGSLLAFTAYAWLLRNAPITTVSTYAYVNPVIAVMLGFAFVSEPVSATTLIGMLVIVASVAFIVRREGVSTAKAEPAPTLEALSQPEPASTPARV